MGRIIEPSRRGLIIGAMASLFAAPAIVRASSLMAVKVVPIARLEDYYYERVVASRTNLLREYLMADILNIIDKPRYPKMWDGFVVRT